MVVSSLGRGSVLSIVLWGIMQLSASTSQILLWVTDTQPCCIYSCVTFNSEICEDRESVRKQEFDPFNDTNQHSHRQYIQIIIIPVGFTIASFIGIAVTSAGIALYGQVLWDPLKLIDHWDNRAAAFFASFAFTLGTLGTNISANSLSAGNDMTALWPRYINIRRGQVICAFLGGWALCPWEILSRCVRLG